MKKSLLTLSLAFVTIGAMAQEIISSCEETTMPEECVATMTNTLVTTDESAKKHSKSNGVYYLKPEGSMYYVYQSIDGISFYTRLAVPAWQTFKYINKATYPKDCTWAFDTTNFSIFADENNDLPLSLTPGYEYYGGPILTYNDISYYMGGTATISFLPRVAAYNSMQWLGFLDNRQHSTMNDNVLDSGFVIGTGNFKGDIYFTDPADGKVYYQDGTWACTGAQQSFPAPASPLYVEDVYLIASTFTSNKNFDPIKNEGALTLQICDAETDEVMATLTTGPGEFEYWMSDTYSTFNEQYIYGGLRFVQKEEDPILGTVEVPFVIDRAVTVKLTGFDNLDNFTNEYAGCGVRIFRLYDSDDPNAIPNVQPTFECPEGMDYYPAYVYSEFGLAVLFNSLMDYVSVADTLYWSNGATITGYSTLRISADGETCSNEIYGADTYDLGALYVTTCCAWFEDDGSENYGFTELPDWIRMPVIDTSNYDPQYSRSYYNLVSFVAEPNEGEERTATFYVTGRGYTDTTLVTVVQDGGYVVPEGISTVESTTATSTDNTYSVSGQRVSDTTKGVVIRDGKKIINK